MMSQANLTTSFLRRKSSTLLPVKRVETPYPPLTNDDRNCAATSTSPYAYDNRRWIHGAGRRTRANAKKSWKLPPPLIKAEKRESGIWSDLLMPIKMIWIWFSEIERR